MEADIFYSVQLQLDKEKSCGQASQLRLSVIVRKEAAVATPECKEADLCAGHAVDAVDVWLDVARPPPCRGRVQRHHGARPGVAVVVGLPRPQRGGQRQLPLSPPVTVTISD